MGMFGFFKSLMAQWLGRVSQRHEIFFHNLKVIGSNSS